MNILSFLSVKKSAERACKSFSSSGISIKPIRHSLILSSLLLASGPLALAGLQDLVLSEINYHPITAEELEFLEIWNSGQAPVQMQGVQITDAVTYTFGSLTLNPNQRVVICSDRTQFLNFYTPRFPDIAQKLASGTFVNRLNNAEETLTLLEPNGTLIQTVFYQDTAPWPNRADGAGSSLEWIHEGPRSNDSSTHWRPSSLIHGSPGASGLESKIPLALNEILTHTDPPLEDAVEVTNLSSEAIAIGGWYLTDSINELTRYKIPDGVAIEPSGFHVFYEIAFNVNNPNIPFALSSAFGDRILLIAADSNGQPYQFVDDLEFGAMQNGISYGRHPDGTGSWSRMSTLSFGTSVKRGDDPAAISVFRTGLGAPNTNPLVGPLLVQEIHYHPFDSGVEYVTLFNDAIFPVQLYDPLARTNTWSLQNAVEFVFPQDVIIQPKETIVIAGEDPTPFRIRTSTKDSVQVFGPFLGALNNAGETLDLVKPDPPQTTGDQIGFVPQIIVESVPYKPITPWPPKADGLGGSLIRTGLTGSPGNADQWAAGFPTYDADSDSDGAPDSWEVWYGLNPILGSDVTQDRDQDGSSELEEFLAGSDPQNAQSILNCTVARSSTAGALDITLLRRPDRNYIIESSPTLEPGATWIQVDQFSALEASFSGPMTFTPTTTTTNFSVPSNGAPLFFRAREVTALGVD